MKQPSVETKIKDISTLHHDLVNIMLRNGLTFNKSLEGLDGTGDLHTTATEIESILSTQQAQIQALIEKSSHNNQHNVFHEYPDKGVCPICGKMTEGGQMVIVKEYHKTCLKEKK